MADDATKFLLGEDAIPTHWVNLLPDLPGDPLPPLHPGTMAPAGPEDLDADLPDGAHRAGGQRRARGRDPRGGPRGLPAVAPDAAVPRAAPGARARYAGAHLLQVRGRLARRLAQAEHGRPAGLRERAGRHPEAHDRDRRRAVGLVAGVRLPAVRPGVRGLHGRLVLRPEALPALDDADVGRDRAPLAQRPDRVRPRQRRHPTGSLGIAISEAVEVAAQDEDTNYSLGLGAQPRPAAPDGHRPGDDRADGAGRRRSPTSSSAASAAARTSPAWPSRGCGASCATAPARASSRPSRRRARR